MNEENDKAPKISKLRELIEQLEAPKKTGGYGRPRRDIFRIEDDEGFFTTSGAAARKSVHNEADNYKRHTRNFVASGKQDDVARYAPFSIDSFDEAEEAGSDIAEASKKKKYEKHASKHSAKAKESEERFTTANQVYDYALNLLTFRDYSKAEMLEKLMKKGAAEDFSKAAIAKLLEYNFLNEERYAFRVYEMWLNKRVYGRQHLQAELKKRSVESECIAKVMEGFSFELEKERAEAAADLFVQQNRKKLQELQRLGQMEDNTSDVTDTVEEFFLDEEALEGDEVSNLKFAKKGSKKTSKWGNRWSFSKQSKAAERMAALKKIQAAAGRFMAARGFSARYMHILLSRLNRDNDM